MKKSFYLFLLGTLTLGFAACDSKTTGKADDPTAESVTVKADGVKFTIEVKDVTSSTAKVTVTPDDETVGYYWDFMPTANFEEYKSDAEVFDALREYYEYEFEYMGYFGYEMSYADLVLTGANTYDCEELDTNTEYTVFAFLLDANGKFGTELATRKFVTLDGPASSGSSDDDFNWDDYDWGDYGDYDLDSYYYPNQPESPINFEIKDIEVFAATNFGEVATGFDNVSVFIGDKDTVNYINLELFVNIGATELPVGTFTPAVEEFANNTWFPGDYYYYSNYYVASYAFNKDKNEVVWLESGNFVIAKDGENYSIKADNVKGHDGSTLTLDYTGKVNFVDYSNYTEEEVSAKAAKRKAVAQRKIGKHVQHPVTLRRIVKK